MSKHLISAWRMFAMVVYAIALLFAIVMGIAGHYIINGDTDEKEPEPEYKYTQPKPGIECVSRRSRPLGCYRVAGGDS